MGGRKFIICNILFFGISNIVNGQVYNFSLARNMQKNKQIFPVIPGIKMYYKNGEIGVEFSFRDFFSENVVEGRGGGGGGGSSGGGGGGKKTGPLQRIIRTMMMIPLAMQILSFPGALAEIKMSLIRSLLVAKMALIMLIFNAFRNSQNKEIVVVQKIPPPQHYDHYYHPYPSEDENEDKGWFGR